MNKLDNYIVIFEENSGLATAISLVALFIIAAFSYWAVKKILLRLLNKVMRFTTIGRDQEILQHGVKEKLAEIVPALIIIGGIGLVPALPVTLTSIIINVASAVIILSVARVIAALLNVANTLYNRRPDAHNKPIKGYIQVLKLGVFIVAAILMIAALIDKSPLILLSGLGAMAAVLMLIFQDTLLSLVASVQISSSDMVRVGDWIEMPHLNADGDVIDIALHTVKVQNWDKTVTTLPTRKLVTDPFKNWRAMHESGGRRIKRAIYLDQSSIHFLTPEEKDGLKHFRLLQDYLARKEAEIEEWNNTLGETGKFVMNTRRITNIGTFRAYVFEYLRAHKLINQNMTMLVRQLQPTADGLPLEIYCFTNNTAWAVYENIQSDIFDHLYAILPEFGLRAFQNPSGHDMQKLGFGGCDS